MANLSSLLGSSAGFEVIDVQNFTASGTWAKPAAVTADDWVIVDLWGGGGSGSAGPSSAVGGGGGAHNRGIFKASDLASSETVIVGAGGAAVVYNSPGNDGGYSEFKGLRAYGGRGGGASYPATGGGIFSMGEPPASQARGGEPAGGNYNAQVGIWGGGGSHSGNLNIDGVHGGGASAYPSSDTRAGNSIWGGAGGGTYSSSPHLAEPGTSLFGGSGGAASDVYGGTGSDGNAPGGGGGGAYGSGSASGAGGDGLVRVYVIRGGTPSMDMVV